MIWRYNCGDTIHGLRRGLNRELRRRLRKILRNRLRNRLSRLRNELRNRLRSGLYSDCIRVPGSSLLFCIRRIYIILIRLEFTWLESLFVMLIDHFNSILN